MEKVAWKTCSKNRIKKDILTKRVVRILWIYGWFFGSEFLLLSSFFFSFYSWVHQEPYYMKNKPTPWTVTGTCCNIPESGTSRTK